MAQFLDVAQMHSFVNTYLLKNGQIDVDAVDRYGPQIGISSKDLPSSIKTAKDLQLFAFTKQCNTFGVDVNFAKNQKDISKLLSKGIKSQEQLAQFEKSDGGQLAVSNPINQDRKDVSGYNGSKPKLWLTA